MAATVGAGSQAVRTQSGQLSTELTDCARAAATASVELVARARKRRRMWFLTVSGLRWSSAAICFVERPCSRRRSTSTAWRGVRCGGVARRRGCRLGVPPSIRETPTTLSPFLSGTALSSTATRVPAVETETQVASVAGDEQHLGE